MSRSCENPWEKSLFVWASNWVCPPWVSPPSHDSSRILCLKVYGVADDTARIMVIRTDMIMSLVTMLPCVARIAAVFVFQSIAWEPSAMGCMARSLYYGASADFSPTDFVLYWSRACSKETMDNADNQWTKNEFPKIQKGIVPPADLWWMWGVVWRWPKLFSCCVFSLA